MKGEEAIRCLAYVIWQVKQRQGIPSTPIENWEEAKETLSGSSSVQLRKIIDLIFKIVCVFAEEK